MKMSTVSLTRIGNNSGKQLESIEKQLESIRKDVE